MPITGFTGMKVFTATLARDREQLGEKVTAWLRANPGLEIVNTTSLQSSDNAFHCITICLFYRERAIAAAAKAA